MSEYISDEEYQMAYQNIYIYIWQEIAKQMVKHNGIINVTKNVTGWGSAEEGGI